MRHDTLPSLHSIVILTGAGISAESGLQTFRASDGLWCGHRVEEVATPEAYLRQPQKVQEFYNLRRAQLKEVEPNAAHRALARLQAEWRGEMLLVTQNVDDLHDRAWQETASKGLPPLHMHGELTKIRCDATHRIYEWREDLSQEMRCECCDRAGSLRPHIVWFGEMPFEMDRIYKALQSCDLFISIGTSGAVYPAAGFVQEAKMAGAYTMEVNLESTGRNRLFDEVREGAATLLVPELVETLLEKNRH